MQRLHEQDVTGALMKVFDGSGMVADKADAPIVPVRIDGAQFTPFSRLRGKVDKDFGTPLIHTVRGAGYRLEA